MFHWCSCACDVQTCTHTPCAGPSENTHILSLSLMDEEMLPQIYKQSLHLQTHYICMVFLELQLDLTYPAAPPPLSSVSLSRLRPYLIVCLFSLAAPCIRSQAGRWEMGAQPTTHTFHPWRQKASSNSSCPHALQEALQPCCCPPAPTISGSSLGLMDWRNGICIGMRREEVQNTLHWFWYSLVVFLCGWLPFTFKMFHLSTQEING